MEVQIISVKRNICKIADIDHLENLPLGRFT